MRCVVTCLRNQQSTRRSDRPRVRKGKTELIHVSGYNCFTVTRTFDFKTQYKLTTKNELYVSIEKIALIPVLKNEK